MVKLTEGMVIARTRASDLENVKKLNCWGSELSDVSLLRNMHNVEVLSLSVNKISSLADFQHCHNLQELYIRKNSIKHLDEICYLKDLRKLKNLWLEDNPCAVGDNYRLTVLKMLPQLQKLDNIAVQQEELKDATMYGQELSHPDDRKKSQDSLVSNTTSSSSASPTHHPDASPPQKRILEDVETAGPVRESAERKDSEWRAAQEEQQRLDSERRAHEEAERRAQMQKEAEYRLDLERRAVQQKEEENLRNREEQMRRNQAQYEPETNTTLSRDTEGQAAVNPEESIEQIADEDSSRAGALFGSSNGNYSTTPPTSRIIHPDTNAVYQSRPYLIDAGQEFREENANIRGSTIDEVHRTVQSNYPTPPIRQPAMERVMSQDRPYPVRPKTRNSNILSAVLCLIKELDYASLEVVEMAVRCRMEELED